MKAMTIELSPAAYRRLQEYTSQTGESPESIARQLIEKALPGKMTYEEFLEWADEDTLAEWVDGEVTVTSPASRRHQEIALFLGQVIGLYVRQLGLGRVLVPPFQMKLERSGREPDLLFVAGEHLDQLKETYLEGPADLVVEITSADSIARDRGEKFYEHETGGVREYWLLDPDRRWAEFYRLGEDGRYRTALAGAEGVYHSEVIPGFWLRVEWLWQEPLPDTDGVSWEILGHDHVVRRPGQLIGVEELRRLLDELDKDQQNHRKSQYGEG